jgi:hypothetical protein
MEDLSDYITIARIECHNGVHNDFNEIRELFIKLDEVYGFNCGERVIILRYLDFPDIIDINKISELKKRLESQVNSAKRVKELTMKLESMEESYKEQLNELKALHELKISNLEKEIIRLNRK